MGSVPDPITVQKKTTVDINPLSPAWDIPWSI